MSPNPSIELTCPGKPGHAAHVKRYASQEKAVVFWRRKKSKFEEPHDEPLFAAISSTDQELKAAYARTSQTMPEFREHVLRQGVHICSAKLQFRDPNESERTGKDVILYLWLTSVSHDSASGTYTGTFFDVPPELHEWHWPGQRLQFEADDVFDWMVNDEGILYGGFTLRVNRSRLPESEREAYDHYIGVKQWVQWDKQ